MAFGLTACKEEEQGRPLSYEKGVYKGNGDSKLSPETIKKLKSRANGQSGVKVGNL